MRIDKTVFISYRRSDSGWAIAIYRALTQRGFDVFIDYLDIGSGSFERVILDDIRARAHFLVLLTPDALDRVTDPDDWLKREIESAIASERNVIPVLLAGFSFDRPAFASKLSGTLERLRDYNALTVPEGYFDQAMERLERDYLSVPLDTILQPASPIAQQSARNQQQAADAAIERGASPPGNGSTDSESRFAPSSTARPPIEAAATTQAVPPSATPGRPRGRVDSRDAAGPPRRLVHVRTSVRAAGRFDRFLVGRQRKEGCMNPKLLLLFILIGAVPYWPGSSFAQPNEPQLEQGVDRPGHDFRSFDLQSDESMSCRSACLDDRQCRAWTYVKPGHQGPKARCRLKTVAPQPQTNSCCTSGFINALREIQACRKIGNTTGEVPVTCIGPGGRDFGKAGKTFNKGDKVMILARFYRLHPGDKELAAVYSRKEGDKFVNFSNNKKVLKFKNDGDSWAFWFPAHFAKEGQWRVNVALTGEGLTGQVLGKVEYCVNCSQE